MIGVAGPVADLARGGRRRPCAAVRAAAWAGGGRPVRRAAPPAQRQARRRARSGAAADAAAVVAPPPVVPEPASAAGPVGAPCACATLLLDVLRVPTRRRGRHVRVARWRLAVLRRGLDRAGGARRRPARHVARHPASRRSCPRGARRARRRGARVETSIVVRALAIVLIVGNHLGGFQLLGGAHALLGIAGWNFARFERGPRDRLRSVARIAVPSVVWLAIAVADRHARASTSTTSCSLHGWIGDPTGPRRLLVHRGDRADPAGRRPCSSRSHP